MIDELIERVRGLTGPDKATDDAIKISIAGHMIAAGATAEQVAITVGGNLYDPSPAWTASLDAAVALVERVLPGWDQGSSFLGEDGGYAEVWEHGWHDDTVVKAHAKTQAIALILALLSALKAKEAREDE